MAKRKLSSSQFDVVLMNNIVYNGSGWQLDNLYAPGTIIFQIYTYSCESWSDFSFNGTYTDENQTINVSSRSSATGDTWSRWYTNLTAPVNNILQIKFELAAEEYYEIGG